MKGNPISPQKRRGLFGVPVVALTPLTTIDFPGELAAVFFTHGCPWRCPYCHNKSLRTKQILLPEKELLTFLHKRRNKLGAIVFSGGEPLLHPTLPDALAAIQSLGFKTGLHTTGSYPHRLEACLPHLNWIGMDIKAVPGEAYDKITGQKDSWKPVSQTLALLKTWENPVQFRTTWLKSDTEGRQKILTSLKTLGIDKQHVFQDLIAPQNA